MTLTELRARFNQKIFSDRTNTTVPTAVIDGYIDESYQEYLIIALNANGEWQTNGNFFTANIQTGKRDIAFETNLLKVNEVYIKSTPTGEYIKAKQRDVQNISSEPLTDYFPSTPEYDLTDKNIFIYIPETSIVAVTAGVQIHAQTEFTSLVNTGDEPKIPLAFQKYLYVCGSYNYCQDNEMWNKARSLKDDKKELEGLIEEFYDNRSSVHPAQLIAAEENLY